MPRGRRRSPQHVRDALRWLAWARGDLTTAQIYAQDGRVPFRNSVYFAQQAAEKAMKAAIVLADDAFDRIHDLEALATQLPTGLTMSVTTAELARLTDLAMESRYPEEADVIGADAAAAAVHTASEVVEAVSRHFVAMGAEPAQAVAARPPTDVTTDPDPRNARK